MSAKADEVAAEWCALGELKPWARNPRRNDQAAERVADSIRRFGFGAPIVARKEDKRIIAGHTRFKAAKLLGLKRVPVRLLDISDRDADILALADNKLGEIADWDDASVAKILAEHSFADAAFAGWTGKELGALADEIIGGQNLEPSTTPDGDIRDVGFSVRVSGKLASQAEVIARIERAVDGIEGVVVECL